MRIVPLSKVPHFAATTLSKKRIDLSKWRGEKVLLVFLRNGSCALCNLRVRHLAAKYAPWSEKGLRILAVFESSPEDMEPFVGKQYPPFELVPDPTARLYDLFGVETSQPIVTSIFEHPEVLATVKKAAEAGFPLTPQEGSNFFRLPAEFLIDEGGIVRVAHYTTRIVDHLDDETIEAFLNGTTSVVNDARVVVL